jgi:hypothetical protein
MSVVISRFVSTKGLLLSPSCPLGRQDRDPCIIRKTAFRLLQRGVLTPFQVPVTARRGAGTPLGSRGRSSCSFLTDLCKALRIVNAWGYGQPHLGHMVLVVAGRLINPRDMPSLAQSRLILFSTRAVSLKTWDEAGMFDLEVVLYHPLQEYGVQAADAIGRTFG